VVSVFLIPVQWMANVLWKVGELWPLLSTPQEHPIAGLIFGLFVFFVYLPLVFYVAGSWIGLCAWIKDNDELTSKPASRASLPPR
jgi:hypothetical protein